MKFSVAAGAEHLDPLSPDRPLRPASGLQRAAGLPRAAADEGLRDRGAGARHAPARRPDPGRLRAALSREDPGGPAGPRLPRRAALQLRLSRARLQELRGGPAARRRIAALHREPRASRRRPIRPAIRRSNGRASAARSAAQFMKVVDPDYDAPGGSTLATQIEKYRHSPSGVTASIARQVAPDVLGDAARLLRTARTRRSRAGASCSTT